MFFNLIVTCLWPSTIQFIIQDHKNMSHCLLVFFRPIHNALGSLCTKVKSFEIDQLFFNLNYSRGCCRLFKKYYSVIVVKGWVSLR